MIIDEGSAVPFVGTRYAMLDGVRTWIQQDTSVGSEQIILTAIPEPSSLLLLGAAL